jgi:calcium-dependent protein kinase
MKSLFQAINHCHAQGIVHRDIKPDNIMITNSETVRLIDFGLSKASKNNRNLTTVAGTPYYMAPEVLEGSYSQKADIWSLGVLLYTLVCGYLPF